MATFAPLGESLRSFSSNGELPLPFSEVRKGDAVVEEEEARVKAKHIEDEEKSRPNSSSSRGRGAGGGGGGSYAALLPKRTGEDATVYPPVAAKDFRGENCDPKRRRGALDDDASSSPPPPALAPQPSSSSSSSSAPIPEEEPPEDESEEALAAKAAATALSGERLLRWLRAAAADAAGTPGEASEGGDGDDGAPLPVAVVDLPKHLGGGRGLVATRDVAPGEALIAVPLSLALVESDPPASSSPPSSPPGGGGESASASAAPPSSSGAEDFLSRAPWPVRMGLELLERRHEARRRAEESEQESALLGGGGDGGDGGEDGGTDDPSPSSSPPSSSSLLAALGEAAWFDLLPPSIPLPTTTFTAQELRAAALSPAALEFCRAFGRGVRAAAEGPLRRRLEAAGARAGDPSPALVWATSAVQSRTFVLELPGKGVGGRGGERGGKTAATKVRRVLPPGIDFANHDAAAPTAEARVRHSPSAVQGIGAVEEVVAPRFRGGGGRGGGESVIELVAGAEGIRAGEEVTISYGNHPVDALFSLYGFVPREGGGRGGGEPGEQAEEEEKRRRRRALLSTSTVLFDSLSDVVASAEAVARRFNVPLAAPQGREETHQQRVSRLLRALEPLAAALSAASASRAADPARRQRAGAAAAERALRGRLAAAENGEEEEEEQEEAKKAAFWQALLLTEGGCDPRANAACKAAAKLLLEPCFARAGVAPAPNGGDLLAARVSQLLSALEAASEAPDTPAGREAAQLCAARGRILRSAARALGVPVPQGGGGGAGRKKSKGSAGEKEEGGKSSLSPQSPSQLELQPPTAASKKKKKKSKESDAPPRGAAGKESDSKES